jgi:hypothetical protein
MKTIFIYLSFFCLAVQLNATAQVDPYRMDGCLPVKPKLEKPDNSLKPVYFNYTWRQLFYNGNIQMNGNNFLNMCRSIDDPQIQLQIARYNQLTRNKKNLLCAMIVCAASGYVTLMGSSFASNGYDYTRQYTIMGAGAALLFIATPIIAISTSIPHQKRKEVIFRDLPAAYNFYVESTNK